MSKVLEMKPGFLCVGKVYHRLIESEECYDPSTWSAAASVTS